MASSGQVAGTPIFAREHLGVMGWLDSVTDSTDVNLSKVWETVKDGGAWCAAESDTRRD